MGLIKPLTLKIDEKLWGEFKDVIPRSKHLNDAVVELIREEVERIKSSKGGKS